MPNFEVALESAFFPPPPLYVQMILLVRLRGACDFRSFLEPDPKHRVCCFKKKKVLSSPTSSPRISRGRASAFERASRAPSKMREAFSCMYANREPPIFCRQRKKNVYRCTDSDDDNGSGSQSTESTGFRGFAFGSCQIARVRKPVFYPSLTLPFLCFRPTQVTAKCF